MIILIVIVGLSLLILGHEAGHFFVAKLFKLRVDEFGFGFPPRMFAKKKGETEYSFNWLPFGGFVRIAGEDGEFGLKNGDGSTDKNRLFFAQPAWKKGLIILAGVATNFVLGWFLISAILMVGIPKAVIISSVQPDSPAARIGLQPADIVSNFSTAKDFTRFVKEHAGQTVDLEIKRGDRHLTLSVVPRKETKPGEGAVGVVLVDAGEDRQGILTAAWDGLRRALMISGLTFQSLYELVKTLFFDGSLLPGVVGPVGIFSVAAETGKIGLIYLVQLISIISLNLAVINLVPFPALDGGRFLMILIEKMKGSPISRKTEAIVNATGFLFLIALMIALTARDVGKLF
ncbi:MAG: site-2 protease family protein [Candidatus Liptonbacteria bacterium]|nr:site-2 protease family protein [Candidatus Liptonbacteria bacterium]